jgi:hypothetical protein
MAVRIRPSDLRVVGLVSKESHKLRQSESFSEPATFSAIGQARYGASVGRKKTLVQIQYR